VSKENARKRKFEQERMWERENVRKREYEKEKI
jgi:hypothetical protein